METEPIQSEDNILNSFLEEQEPLGKEFEDVLKENLWDLYENTIN